MRTITEIRNDANSPFLATRGYVSVSHDELEQLLSIAEATATMERAETAYYALIHGDDPHNNEKKEVAYMTYMAAVANALAKVRAARAAGLFVEVGRKPLDMRCPKCGSDVGGWRTDIPDTRVCCNCHNQWILEVL